MKLNPEELVVTSFQTGGQVAALAGTVPSVPPACPLYPTPHTRCFECPPQTLNICPITGGE